MKTWRDLPPARRRRLLADLQVDLDDWRTTQLSEQEYEGEAKERIEEYLLAMKALRMYGPPATPPKRRRRDSRRDQATIGEPRVLQTHIAQLAKALTKFTARWGRPEKTSCEELRRFYDGPSNSIAGQIGRYAIARLRVLVNGPVEYNGKIWLLPAL